MESEITVHHNGQKAVKGQQKAVVYIDHREGKSGITEYLTELDAVVEPKQLLVGDFVCSDRVCVERKTVQDFLQSIFNQRMFEQLRNLSESFERPVLIIEGNQTQLFTDRNVHGNAVRGMLTTIAVDFGIPIIWTRNQRETAAQVFWMANREQVLEKREPCLRAKRKALTLRDQQEFLVAGLPCVSTKLSKRLLAEFKTIKRMFNAKEERFTKIDKIGKEKAKRIWELINSEYV